MQAKKAPYADPCDSVSTYLGFHLILQERASKNNTFIYVKIPEVSLLVSYKVCVSLFSSILVLVQCSILVLLYISVNGRISGNSEIAVIHSL